MVCGPGSTARGRAVRPSLGTVFLRVREAFFAAIVDVLRWTKRGLRRPGRGGRPAAGQPPGARRQRSRILVDPDAAAPAGGRANPPVQAGGHTLERVQAGE